jgi:hypothetical protein
MLTDMASNKHQEVNLAKFQMMLTTGVSGVGEFIKISDGTQEIHCFLQG